MNCPLCNTHNREDANFCKNCGLLLITICPRCGLELPDSPNFCDHCGLMLKDTARLSWWEEDQAKSKEFTSTFSVRPPAQESIARPDTTQSDWQATRKDEFPVTSVNPPVTFRTPDSSSKISTNNRLQQYIPKELLQKLETARTSGTMAGERKVVTMLFCDVKDSTAAAELLDPEEWSEIINGALEHMIRPVYQYEGTLARLMGDGLLAFFGAPIAHEDDPQRAILASLDILSAIKPYRDQIRERYGMDFDVRIGINTGLVVVGEVGSDLRMEYTALGDAINLASRMEQTAAPGSVQISFDTYKLVRNLFEFEDLGGIKIKGKDQPVPAYRVIKQKKHSHRPRGIEGLFAEMVGRENEMIAMRNVISRLKQGVGQIICVLGEAGLGKSRLVQETYKVYEESIHPDGNWYEIQCLSYESRQAYGLLQRLIRRMSGLTRDDSPVIVREKIAQIIEILPEGRRKRAQQIFETLFNFDSGNGRVHMEGETFKHELLDVVCDWWRISFAKVPTVLVFDDMHWSDAASVDLLVQLLPLIGEIPLIFICAMRTERQAPAWLIRIAADEHYRHLFTELTLQHLSDSESNELISRLLAIAEIPDRLRTSILEKTGGNPFFIEEVVRTLIDTGAVISEERSTNGKMLRYWRTSGKDTSIALPENLQSLLSARIDRLEEGTRSTLQMASVIGRSFYHRVLQAVDEANQELDQRLDTLLQLDMIREAARLPEVEYVFRNPLTQEAVYETILLKRRREFHRRVGEAMELLYPERIEGLFGLLANHFTLAGMHSKAIEYSRQAAKQALAMYAYEDALQNLLAALELIQENENTEVHLNLLEEIGDAYNILRDGERTIEYYQQALELLEKLPDIDRMVFIRLHRKILQMIAELKWSVGISRLRSANQSRMASRASLEEKLDYLLSRPPERETNNVLVALSVDSWRLQEPPDWESAQKFAQSAVDNAQKLDSPIDLSIALGSLSTVLDGRSLLREYLAVCNQRLEICNDSSFDNQDERVEALRSSGAAFTFVGEYEQGLSRLQQAYDLAVKVKAINQQAGILGLQAQCYFRLDRWDEVFTVEAVWRDLERRYSRERVGET